ncbi:MAG: GAF domain-containing protein [Proteobacteria bacterium]|nr:GAF domain-containing protein [Pseudomonadota bacterium]
MTDKIKDTGEEPLVQKKEEFLQIFKKGAEFTQELLKENERLRYKLAQLEESTGSLPGDSSGSDEKLRRKIEDLQAEIENLTVAFKKVESENTDFASRYVDIEEENNNLANLYIASYQLHSTLDFSEVLQIIMEIIINLIGAEVFAVLLLDETSHCLLPVATEGITEEEVPEIKVGDGVIGGVLKSSESYFTQDLSSKGDVDPLDPLVCIPLTIKDQVIGVIVIYKLLMQKEKFRDVDYELFTLLAGHAATAIFAARLYSESERKLSTIQGFIGLLTK